MSALFALVRFETAGQTQTVLAFILLILLALVFLLRREPWTVLTILARRVIKAGVGWFSFDFGEQAEPSQKLEG